MTLRAIAVVVLVLLLAPAGRGADLTESYTHIRSTEAELVDAVHDAVAHSPSFRAIVAELDRSDVVVYLTIERQPTAVAAHVALIGVASGRRYLRVSVDPRFVGCQRAGILGHELHHAMEIALEPSVVDERSLARLYRRIGFESCGARRACFETEGAMEAGRQIEREMSGTLAR